MGLFLFRLTVFFPRPRASVCTPSVPRVRSGRRPSQFFWFPSCRGRCLLRTCFVTKAGRGRSTRSSSGLPTRGSARRSRARGERWRVGTVLPGRGGGAATSRRAAATGDGGGRLPKNPDALTWKDAPRRRGRAPEIPGPITTFRRPPMPLQSLDLDRFRWRSVQSGRGGN